MYKLCNVFFYLLNQLPTQMSLYTSNILPFSIYLCVLIKLGGQKYSYPLNYTCINVPFIGEIFRMGIEKYKYHKYVVLAF